MATTNPPATPPRSGLDREEPEQSQEDDIPADDGGKADDAGDAGMPGKRPLRDVERE